MYRTAQNITIRTTSKFGGRSYASMPVLTLPAITWNKQWTKRKMRKKVNLMRDSTSITNNFQKQCFWCAPTNSKTMHTQKLHKQAIETATILDLTKKILLVETRRSTTWLYFSKFYNSRKGASQHVLVQGQHCVKQPVRDQQCVKYIAWFLYLCS